MAQREAGRRVRGRTAVQGLCGGRQIKSSCVQKICGGLAAPLGVEDRKGGFCWQLHDEGVGRCKGREWVSGNVGLGICAGDGRGNEGGTQWVGSVPNPVLGCKRVEGLVHWRTACGGLGKEGAWAGGGEVTLAKKYVRKV